MPSKDVLEKELRSTRTPRGRHYHAEQARAAAKLVADKYKTDKKLKGLAVKALENIKSDKSWVENWEKPELVRDELDFEINDLKGALSPSKRHETKTKIEVAEEQDRKEKLERLRGKSAGFRALEHRLEHGAGMTARVARFAKKHKTPLLVGGGLLVLYWFFRKPKVAALPTHLAGYPASTPYPYSGSPAIGWW